MGLSPTQGEKHMNSAWDYKGASIWTRDEKMKRFKQGEEFAKRKQDKSDINEKNQVFFYCKALSKKNG